MDGGDRRAGAGRGGKPVSGAAVAAASAGGRQHRPAWLSYDEGGNWRPAGSLEGAGRVQACTLHIRPRRCRQLRLRLTGRGGCRIYSLSAVYEKGSDGHDPDHASRPQRQSPADGHGTVCVSVPDGSAAEPGLGQLETGGRTSSSGGGTAGGGGTERTTGAIRS